MAAAKRADTGADKIIDEAKQVFELCEEVERENRRDALDDIKFARLDDQWPLKIRRDREMEGRPCLTINRLTPAIRQVLNDARQNKPAIVVHPVDGDADPGTAEVLNGLIRNIEQSSDAEVAYDTALDFAVTGGFGYFRINTQYAHDDTFEQDIVIERISNPFSVYGDPHSNAADSSDWNTAFVVDAVPLDIFEKTWKGAEPIDWNTSDYSRLKGPWLNEERRVLVAEYWTRDEITKRVLALSDGQIIAEDVYAVQKELFDALGVSVMGRPREVKSFKVTQRIITGCEELDKVEWAGKYIPIVPVYGEEVQVEGKRIFRSLVRGAKDAQRMFNYWRTTTTELVALAPKAPWIGRVGAFVTDAEKWATANTETHQYLEYDGPEMPQRLPFAGIPAGAIQEALNSADDIKSVTGIYDASLGAKSNETSGRAIMARQREGDVANFHYIDNLSRAIRHAGRILVDLIPKVYSTPRVLRVLGPDGKPSIKKVNQPTEEEVKNPQTGQLEKIETIYKLDVGKYDVTVTAGPSFTSRREEAATQMIELIRAFPAAAPVIGDLLASNLDWPGADEISERLRALLPEQLRGGENPEVAQAKQVIAQMGEELKKAQEQVKSKEGDLLVKLAQLEGDKESRRLDERKVDIDAYNAETNRIKALNTKDAPMDPQSLAVLVHNAVRAALMSPDVLPGEGPGPDDAMAHEMAESPEFEAYEDTPEIEAMEAAEGGPEPDESGFGGGVEPPEADLAEPPEEGEPEGF